MKNEINAWLVDILNTIKDIRLFISEINSFEDFKNDIKTQRAVERSLEIIGEAVNRILKQQPNFPIDNARRIIDTRNRIIHGYDSVSQEIIWAISIKHLDVLEEEIRAILNDNE